jgi:hypothetical protein
VEEWLSGAKVGKWGGVQRVTVRAVEDEGVWSSNAQHDGTIAILYCTSPFCGIDIETKNTILSAVTSPIAMALPPKITIQKILNGKFQN